MKTLQTIFKTFWLSLFLVGAGLILAASFVALGCQKDEAKNIITVMMPPWAEPSTKLLQEFTLETGIEVVMNIVGWDQIRNKISIAAVGKESPADVVEVDWSWVGEFYSAGWLEALTLTESDKKDIPTISSFIVDETIWAIPYSNDFRLAYYNAEHYSKAGFNKAPETWKEILDASIKIKEMGIVDYPISITLSATESTTTTLFWLTLSQFGAVFNSDFSLNEKNALKALNFINTMVHDEKIIDPATQNMVDLEVWQKILTGDTSFTVGPVQYIGLINNQEKSQTVGKVFPVLIPKGIQETSVRSATFALPEAVGITKYSKNKESAKKFITWYTSAKTQEALFQEQGLIPTRVIALDALISAGKIEGGDILIDQSSYITAPFPGGIPDWYPGMSNAIYNSINTMVAKGITPKEATAAIAKKIKELSSR